MREMKEEGRRESEARDARRGRGSEREARDEGIGRG
jgi:hypothetical protein